MNVIQRFEQLYTRLDHKAVDTLDTIYAADITFIDPVTQHSGLEELARYFRALLQDTLSCDFVIHTLHPADDIYIATWTMTYRHSRIQSGKAISVEGISQLKIEKDLIVYHRDYYDIGAMVYEHIPILGYFIRIIKRGLTK